MKPDIIKELKICRRCGEEYEAEIILVLGARLLRGNGYCPDCAKKALAEQEAKEKAAKEADIISKRHKWRLSCGIAQKFMNEEFGTFNKDRQKKAYEKCLAYAEKFPIEDCRGYPSLLLYSDHSWGVGKSHLASAIAHLILNRWQGETAICPVHFTTEPDLLMQIQATFSYNPEEKHYRESEADILNRLIGVPLLILDDIGKRRTHDPRFVQRIMFALIDGRYRAMKPMVMTANLTPERLKLYLGGGQGDEAAYDRLLEMCNDDKGLKFFQLEGESYRRK